jgi:hypothetical protein
MTPSKQAIITQGKEAGEGEEGEGEGREETEETV